MIVITILPFAGPIQQKTRRMICAMAMLTTAIEKDLKRIEKLIIPLQAYLIRI
jgi:hypothetical protein